MSVVLGAELASTPMTDDAGRVTTPWYRFLRQLAGVSIATTLSSTCDDVTASRPMGGVFPNMTGKLLVVNVEATLSVGNYLEIRCDASQPPVLRVAKFMLPSDSGGTQVITATVLVRPGYRYELLGGAAINKVIEWSLG